MPKVKVTHDEIIDCIERLTNAIYTLGNMPSDVRPAYTELVIARKMIRKMRGVVERNPLNES